MEFGRLDPMGGPAATVFFSQTISEDIHPLLGRLGARFTTPRAGGRKPKPSRQTSLDVSLTPNQLGLSATDWPASEYYDRIGPTEPLPMYLSVRNVATSSEHWDYLLENNILPESLTQLVDVGCYIKGPMAYDAVNSLAKIIETELLGKLRTPAQK